MLHLIAFLSCFLFSSFAFQPVCAGGSMGRGLDSPPTDAFHSRVPSPSCLPCRCTKYLSRILDLKGCLSLMKREVKTALDQAGKSYGLMRQISVLEDKVSGLVAQVMHLKECDSFLVDFIESACEQLKCKFLADLLEFLAACFVFIF
jgi:hypothetical protein